MKNIKFDKIVIVEKSTQVILTSMQSQRVPRCVMADSYCKRSCGCSEKYILEFTMLETTTEIYLCENTFDLTDDADIMPN